MPSKDPTPQGGDKLHSSVAAFEVRHHTGAPSEHGGFTRRCGRRAPTDKSPCMYMFGHAGHHAWEPVNTRAN
jgi:hypothetical protein